MTQQRWQVEGYVKNAGFVADLGARALELLAPKPGERILDLGCGDGRLTLKIKEAGADVLGIDSSADLLLAAEARGLDVIQMDGQALALNRTFDAVFSNAALHWMQDADAVVRGVRSSLKPDGRFVGEFGGFGNVAAIVTGLLASLDKFGIDTAGRNPWYFPTVGAYQSLLERHGFTVLDIALIPRPTPLPTGIEGWLATFANPFLAGLDERTQHHVLAHAIELLSSSLCDDQGHWHADYVRLRFAARLSA